MATIPIHRNALAAHHVCDADDPRYSLCGVKVEADGTVVATNGHVLIRVFVGGALQADLAVLPDDKLIALARKELGELIGAEGQPDLCRITRWEGAMPQYHLGHLDLVKQIESRVAELPGLELAGNAYRGVGVPQCIHSGEQAAQRVLGSSRPKRRINDE